MRKILLLLLVTGAVLSTEAQVTKPAIASPEALTDGLIFKELEYNFGSIPQGKPVYHTFVITNTGKTATKLSNVHASCGCTTPEWNQDEIAPGATTTIKVGYNAAAAGNFDKTITVSYNDNTQTKILKIKGDVWKAPEGSAPANAGVDFLKKQNL